MADPLRPELVAEALARRALRQQILGQVFANIAAESFSNNRAPLVAFMTDPLSVLKGAGVGGPTNMVPDGVLGTSGGITWQIEQLKVSLGMIAGAAEDDVLDKIILRVGLSTAIRGKLKPGTRIFEVEPNSSIPAGCK